MSGQFGDWGKISRFLNQGALSAAVGRHFGDAVAKNAQLLRRNIVLGIRNQRAEWPPIQAETIRRKGSSKILIDSGEMMRSVGTRRLHEFVWFVGIPRGARAGRKRRGRARIAEYAARHEFGMVVRGRTGRGRTSGTVRILKRPFIAPAVAESSAVMDDNFYAAGRRTIEDLLR